MATKTATMIQKQPVLDAALLDRALSAYGRDDLVYWLREHVARIVRDTTAPGVDDYAQALRRAPGRAAENDVLATLYDAGVEMTARLTVTGMAGKSMSKVTLANRTACGDASASALHIPTIRRERGVTTRLFSLSLPSGDLDALRAESERRAIPASFLIHTALHRTIEEN